jgi:superfamily II DNA or RNA helicase
MRTQPSTKVIKSKKKTKAQSKLTNRTSHLKKPKDLDLEEWQVRLRREYGQQQKFDLINIGDHAVFSDFTVENPASKKTYRVAIRGTQLWDNYCSCPDFATNTLGTCKHIEFTLAKLQRRQGAKAILSAGFHPPYSEIFLYYGNKREVVFRPGTDCPTQLLKITRDYFDREGKLRPESYQRFDTFLKEIEAFAENHEIRCHEDTYAYIAHVRDKLHLESTIDKIFSQGNESPIFENIVKTRLYPYQKIGALFAAKAGRCLIADDMGLGKTIQAITACEILARFMGIQRILVVTPTSLKHQWCQEIQKFTDRTVEVIEGMNLERARRYTSESFYKITNYDVIHRDLEPIRKLEPDLIILDEAQRIKNWKTRTAQTVKMLPSEYAFVLTGTPIENRLEELHSIVQFVDRFRLGPLFRFLDSHQHQDQFGRVIGYRNLGDIGETLKPILVRRKKDEVLQELPERLEKTFFVPMTVPQMDCHTENAEIVAKIVAKWRRFGFLTETDQRRLMICLQNMRMVCNSTYLLDQRTDHGIKVDEVVSSLKELFEIPTTKGVIFSQWIRTHEILMNRIESHNWGHVFFHGGVPSKERKHLINRFKEDPACRLFLSTDAGGVGLNLQNASVVINIDQPWNPAVLEQRIGRVHRLGQHAPVSVLHFVSQGTIEHGMLKVIAFKKSLFTGVLDGGREEFFLEGTKLQQFMETIEQVTSNIPESMPSVSGNGTHTPDQELPPEISLPVGKEAQEEVSIDEVAEASAAGRSQPDRPVQWEEILSTGIELFTRFSQALTAESGSPTSRKAVDQTQTRPTIPIERDPQTGQAHLRIPVPDENVLNAVGNFLGALGRMLTQK